MNNALYISLYKEYFDQFQRGVKSAEYRLLDGKWNTKNVYPGRAVILTDGEHRLEGIIAHVAIKSMNRLNAPLQETLRSIYGDKLFKNTVKGELWEVQIMCIEIRATR